MSSQVLALFGGGPRLAALVHSGEASRRQQHVNVDAMEAYYSLSSASSAVFRTDTSVPTHALNSDMMEGQHATATALPVDKIVFSLHARNSMQVDLSLYSLVLPDSIFIC